MKKIRKTLRTAFQRSFLISLFAIFMLSGILRVGQLSSASAAPNDEIDTVEANEHHSTEGSSQSAQNEVIPSNAVGQPNGQCATLSSIEVALDAIQGRAEELDIRQHALDEKERTLAAAEELVLNQLQQLEAAETRLTDLLAIADSAADDDLTQLTSLYEAMPPEDAAELFGQMDPSFAAGFLSRIRPDAGAAILAELQPERAYAISVILATRNTSLPNGPNQTIDQEQRVE